jgi:DNA helicase-2/ATP-dependent DNA helicase PcrA
VQIVASAGAGKTEVVAQRVAHLLEIGVEPRGIVAFTFTERAAESLKARIEARVSERLGETFLDRMNGCFVGTIHSYCFRLLQVHQSEYETYDVLDDHRLAAFITRVSAQLDIKSLASDGKLFNGIREFLANVEVVDNELLDVDDLDGPFRATVEQFHALLHQYRFLTYGRMVAVAVHALASPDVFEAAHGPLRYLIVDEYQDVSPAQEALIQRIAEPPVELCVVGDDDQSIYQWRGADVKNIVSFTERYHNVRQFKLSTNRRSRPEIIDLANQVSSRIADRFDKRMVADREAAPAEVVLWAAPTETDEAQRIATNIIMLSQLGYRFGDVAVLMRGRVSYPRLLEALHAANIPVAPGGRTALFLSPDAQLFGRTFAWLADHTWRDQAWGNGQAVTLDSLVREYAATFALGARNANVLRRRLDAWKREVKAPTRPINLVRSYYELLASCGVADWDLADPVQVSRLGALARCSAILADYESVRLRSRPDVEVPGDVIGGQDRGSWYHKWLAIHIQNWSLGSFEGFDGEDDIEIDAVNVMTVHQAKGLEWPVVFVPCVSDRRFPSSKTGTAGYWLVPPHRFSRERYEGTITDERRLFYVALTRARDWLSISTHNAVTKQRTHPSPFLGELLNGELPDLEALPMPPKIVAVDEDDATTLNIAFSDLARFQTCGLAYRLRTSLGFQPPIAPELGYGKAVHHILREVAEQTQRRGRPPTPSQVERLFDDHFVLPAASKPAHREMRASAQRLVNRYVRDWNDDLERVWEVERPFELHLPGLVISGRADVILDHEDGQAASLAIVDYKTATTEDDRYDLQLQVYADAGRREGLTVRSAYVHDLAAGDRQAVDVAAPAIEQAEATVVSLAERVRLRDYSASPSSCTCSRCDVRPLCRWAM